MMSKIISVVGPTASGKTALSIALAKEYDAEIVSVDSMQIYRGMDIGTAKVEPQYRSQVKHHMIDVLEPFENCNVRMFVEMARAAVDDVLERGKNCVLAGGTGLYVDHLIQDTRFVDIPGDEKLRAQLSSLTETELYKMLQKQDPAAASRIHANNKKRIVRAMEILTLTGKSITYWNKQSHLNSDPLNAVMIGLNFSNREKLYHRIERRVDIMFEQGLTEEVKSLLSINGFEGSTASDGIGYKELIEFFNNQCTLEQAKETIKRNTRRYAKRQLTWFKRNPDIHWINIDDSTSFDDIVKCAKEFIEEESLC